MPNWVQNLGQGMQEAGGILSPVVAQRQAQERDLLLRSRIALQQAQRELAARTIVSGVQSGSIDPQVGRQKLSELGFGDIPVGPSLEAQGTKAFIDWQGGQGTQSPAVTPPTTGMSPQPGMGSPTPQPGISLPTPAAIASPLYGRYIEGQRAQLEAERARQTLNKPQISYDSKRDRIVQTFPNGEVKTVNLGSPEMIESGFGKELKDSGINPGTKEWDDAWKKRIARETAPTQTQINLSTGGQDPLGTDKNFWFEYYDKTKNLPPMAWGAAGNPTRQQFLKEFPIWKKSHGGTASDTAATQATYKANATALSAVTKDLNTFEPYKRMLDTNADIAIQLGKKVSLTNSALVNKSINWLRQNASNNPDVAEYLAQIRFVQIEAARVINNPRIVGQLTDEARKEIETVINGNAPIAVVERVLNRMKIDGSNRFTAMRTQQADLINQMKGNQPAATETTTSAVKTISSDAEYDALPSGAEFIGPDGKKRRKP